MNTSSISSSGSSDSKSSSPLGNRLKRMKSIAFTRKAYTPNVYELPIPTDSPGISKRERAYRQKKDILCASMYGCNYMTFLILRGTDRRVATAFRAQKLHAAKRKIPFLLTFAEWLAVWRASRKLSLRGSRRGCYVMSRYGDLGPYALGNVFIQLGRNNILEGKKLHRNRRLGIKRVIVCPLKSKGV